MPSLNEKPWQTEGNILVTAGTAADANKKVLWTLKALLTGQISSDAAGSTVAGANSKTGLWTVVGSSDSVAAGMDAVDRWGSTFDATKIVPGGNHSWIVLKSPDALGPYWLTLDLTSGGGNQTALKVAKILPTGGTISVSPSSTDEWTHAVANFIEAVVGPFRCHLLLNATTGEFWFPVGWGGAIKTVVGVQKIDSATDPYPVVSCLAYSITGTTRGPLGHTGSNTTDPLAYNATAAAFRGREPISGSAATAFAAGVVSVASGTTGQGMSQMTAGIDGVWPETPSYLVDNAITPLWMKGRIPDCYWVAPNCPEGSVAVDTGGTVYSAVFSDAWLPWTATYLPII